MIEKKVIKVANTVYLKIVGICLKRLDKKSAKALREYEANIMSAARIKDAAKLAEARAKEQARLAKDRSKAVADMAVDMYASKEVVIDAEQVLAKVVLNNHKID